jgi:hypothetical protein
MSGDVSEMNQHVKESLGRVVVRNRAPVGSTAPAVRRHDDVKASSFLFS